MKKILHLTFIALYALIGMFLVIELCRYFDLYVGPVAELMIYAVWIALCFSAYRWTPRISLSTMRLRKTILEEEEWIHPLMHELNLRTGIDPVPELLILEKPEMDAFAIGRNTIVLSRGLLVQLSELEIKAVLAHEYGHLKNQDTMTHSAFGMASRPPFLIYRVLRVIFPRFKKWFWGKGGIYSKLLLLIAIAAFSYWFIDLVILFVILFIFMKGFPFFNLMIRTVWCYFSRGYEFQQDRFAQSLGCGRHLKTALLKVDSLNSNNLVNSINQLWLTHPMIYMRVRRLEWLEGLRPTP